MNLTPLITFTIPLLLLLLVQQALSVDPFFQACVPKTCGDTQIIKFPFYIQDQQESFCGYPGFHLSCNNGHPIINLSNNSYIIHQIFYQNHTLRVSNTAATTCISLPPLIHNLTLPEDRLNLAQGTTNLFLLFDCNSSIVEDFSSYHYGCGDNGNETGTVLAMFEDDPEFSHATKMCNGTVAAPVEGARNGSQVMLNRGFVLDWTASDCSVCELSGGKCGFNEEIHNFQCYCPDRPHFKHCIRAPNRLALKLGVGIGGPVVLIGILLLGLYVIRRRYKQKYDSSNLHSRYSYSDSKSDLEGIYFGVTIFSYNELEEATNYFDHDKELGDGGFGTVFYGKLKDGREVAVKRLYEHSYRRVEQFLNEVEILTRLRHKNLVSLYGCTSRRSRELLLVYEYIPNGTVAEHLHGDRAEESPLTWPTRLKIAVETASALVYLHASDIIHRDVKTNNILLDSSFGVKVADFGLSRLFPADVTHVSTAPQGTPGYVDPEYHQCYQLTVKSDVYSFGVVLIELISSMPAVDISRHRHEINLSNFAINKIEKHELSELVDPQLGFASDKTVRQMTVQVGELAYKCLQQDNEKRPSMNEVLEKLKEIQSMMCEEENVDATSPGNSGASQSVMPPPSPDWEEADLLKKIWLPPSPNSVTDKWVSSRTTMNSNT